MKRTLIFIGLFAAIFCSACSGVKKESSKPALEQFVKVSKINPKYLELEDGTPFIPNGMNMAFPRPYDDACDTPEKCEQMFEKIEYQLSQLSKYGGNYTRVWVAAPPYEVETAAGVYSEEKFARIDRLLSLAKKYGIRVKLCMEHFYEPNYIPPKPGAFVQGTFSQPEYNGLFKDMEDYLSSKKGRELYLNRLREFSKRYANNPNIFAIELWNEMNCIHASYPTVIEWNKYMMREAKKLFPNHIITQSMGSFDKLKRMNLTLKPMIEIEANELAQIHRYLDEGAQWDVCRGSVDILASNAVSLGLAENFGKPVILAETGAVEPRHAAPFKLYSEDVDGVILHDVMFASFFSGAASAGHCWHWEYYILKNELYWHFGRFAEAVKDVNPIEENFEPKFSENKEVRVYALDGKTMHIAWLRDKSSWWKSELAEKIRPSLVKTTFQIPENLKGKIERIEIYNPWTNKSEKVSFNDESFSVPEFTRSTVVKIYKKDKK